MRLECSIKFAPACVALVFLLGGTPAARAQTPAPVGAQPAAPAGGRAATQAAPPVRGLAGLTELSRSLEQLVEKISPSVVQIFVTGYAPPDEENHAATGEPSLERSSGSGVILDSDGYIITNAHVVEYATRLEVELPFAATGGAQGRSIVRRRGRNVGAQIVAIDHETDLAVVKIDAKGLPALTIGDSEALRPGQLVLAFGSPLGLDSSVTMGVVSAVARQLTPEDPMIYVQTDAPINPGSSGGALVDTDGHLVGINTMIYSKSGGSEGIGFAAPSNIVRNVFTQIRKTGRVRRGEIGVYPQTVTPLMADALKLGPEAGVILSDVTPGGPAARAGLQPGDVVLSLDGKRMENGRQFRVNLYTRSIGDQVAVDVQRAERRLTVRVGVAERDNDVGRLADLVTPQNAIREIGVLGVDLNVAIGAMLPDLRQDKGIVVALVAPGTPFSQQGRLAAGDVIYAINNKPVEGVERLKAALAALAPNDPFVLQVEREGTLLYLSFKVER
jgi:serine protease Do